MRLTIIVSSLLALGCAPPSSSGNRGGGSGSARADAGADNNPTDAGGETPVDAGEEPVVDAGPPPAENGCVAAGTGNQVGDKLASLRLQNCNGDWVDLHDNCGRVKAQMLLLVSGWCSACTQAMRSLRASEDQYANIGFDAMYVLGELGQGEPATVEACAGVAAAKGVRPEEMLVDPQFRTTLGRGWVDYCAPDGRIGLPIQHILDGRDMTLHWSSQCGPEGADPNAIINDLINAP